MPTKPREPSQHLSAAIKSARAALVSTGLFSCFINLLMLTGPLFMLQVYDRVLSSGSVSTLTALVMLVAGLYLLYGFLEFVRARVMVRVGRRVDETLRGRVFDIVSFHALRGNAQVRLTPINDLITARQFLASPGPFAFFDMPWAPIYLCVIFLMHPVLGVASTIAVVLLAALAAVNNKLISKPTGEAQDALSKAQVVSEESMRNVEVASVLGMQHVMRERWESHQETALDQQTLASDKGGMITVASRTLRLMFQSGILALGALLAIRQEISPGAMIAASIIMARALAPVEQAVAHWQPFLAFRASWARLCEILTSTPESETPMPLPMPQGGLEVEGLSVFSASRDSALVQNVSFALEPGAGLGIIGPTGAGKSTLVRGIIGAWPFTRGTVRLDGAELSQWDPAQLGSFLGYLPQEVELFDGTVGENISRFQADADPQAVVAAARQAAVHDMVLQLPEGYNTRVGASGHRLSAGQLQRIGLARAMYGDPVLIILDEPNSNLDSDGESALVQAIINSRRRGATVIVVAHRPSALTALDMLLMIKDGRTVAFGPKDEVLAKVLVQRAASAPAQYAHAAGSPRPAGTQHVAANAAEDAVFEGEAAE